MTDTLSPEGYQVLLGATNYDPVVERELVRTVLGRRVDGIAITGASLDPQAEALLKRAQIPAIQIFELPERPIDMAIGVRNEACGMAVADHLADRGYRRLAVVGSSALADTRAAARAAGFSRQAIARGLPPPAVFVAEQPADVRCGPRLLAEILSATPAIEAVFCVGTQISVGLMLACPRAGVEVPGRLAIAGFSHGDIAAMLNPSLTTIRVPTAEMGQRAGAMLLMRLAGKAVEPASADAGYEVVIGDST
jgi:LacI family gluconate utilization system Gnt-I transcriptional repressor